MVPQMSFESLSSRSCFTFRISWITFACTFYGTSCVVIPGRNKRKAHHKPISSYRLAVYPPIWTPFQNKGVHFAIFYSLSYFLDAFDGIAARALSQTSHLGYYLDMLIDRASSILCLYMASEAIKINGMVPSAFIPTVVSMCYFLIVVVEVLAHGVVVFNAEVLGIHQKKMGFQFYLVRLYLDSKVMLFYGCAAFELCLLGAIVGSPLILMIGLPGFVFRALANICRLWACYTMNKEVKCN